MIPRTASRTRESLTANYDFTILLQRSFIISHHPAVKGGVVAIDADAREILPLLIKRPGAPQMLDRINTVWFASRRRRPAQQRHVPPSLCMGFDLTEVC